MQCINTHSAGPPRRNSSRLLRLPSLAPNIVTAIINGKHLPELKAKRLMRLALKLPTDWAEQRKLLGRLAEILEAIEAASELEQWAEQSTEEVVEFGQLTVPKGHRGDMPLNNWIAAMLATYKQITGKDPATSVGAPERDNEGVPGGPLLRFLEAAGKPLGIELTSDAWRSRVRNLLGLDEN